MLRNARAQRRRHVEKLEDRALLAGVVGVDVIDGNLIVTGDEVDNAVAITAGEQAGQFVVTGLDDADGMSTEVAGAPNGETVAEGVTGNIFVNLREGDDTVILTDAEAPRNVFIRTGLGDDRALIGQFPEASDVQPSFAEEPLPEVPVETGPVAIHGDLHVSTGPNDDVVALVAVEVGRNAHIVTNGGNDRVRLGAGGPDDTIIDQALAQVVDESPWGVSVGQYLGVYLGRGDDAVGAHGLHVGGSLSVVGHAGNKTIGLHHTHVEHYASIFTGAGEDHVRLEGMEAGAAMVYTGAGGDQVDVADATFGMLGVMLGPGDDVLAVGGTYVRHLAYFDGGPGVADTFVNNGGNMLNRRLIRRFEDVVDNTPV